MRNRLSVSGSLPLEIVRQATLRAWSGRRLLQISRPVLNDGKFLHRLKRTISRNERCFRRNGVSRDHQIHTAQ